VDGCLGNNVAVSSAGDTAATCDPLFEDLRTESPQCPLLLSEGCLRASG